MTQQYDLVIRGGTIVDGTGAAPFSGDVGIIGNRIAAVGTIEGSAKEEINATGMIVTPGFVDVHTHYDGQVTWESRLAPSSDHGVTTVVMGNCGVGFAPIRESQRHLAIKLMEGVEDIPEVVMAEGIPWSWETFPEYLDLLETRETDVDFATQIPHSPIRVYVMGERGVNLEPPTETDLAEMRQLTREAIEAGALGVSTSRQLAHAFRDGRPAPSTKTEVDELLALADGLKDAGRGVFQLIPNTNNPGADEFGIVARLQQRSGRPVNFSLLTGGMCGREGLCRLSRQSGRGKHPHQRPILSPPHWPAVRPRPQLSSVLAEPQLQGYRESAAGRKGRGNAGSSLPEAIAVRAAGRSQPLLPLGRAADADSLPARRSAQLRTVAGRQHQGTRRDAGDRRTRTHL
jgi:hypothetical protein